MAMNDPMRVAARHARMGDLPELLRLYANLRAEQSAIRDIWPYADGLDEPTEASLRSLIHEERVTTVIGTIDEAVVGFLLTVEEPLLAPMSGRYVGVVRFIFTDHDARGVGVGAAMLDATMERLEDRGIDLFDAHVSPGHRLAKNFFESNGFKARSITMHRSDAGPFEPTSEPGDASEREDDTKGILPDGSRKTFVFDLDGVVYLDSTGVPGAGEALTALRQAGHQILFATNNSVRAVETVIANITHRTGFVPDPGSVITSGLAAANLLRDTDETCLVLGSDELSATLSGAGIALTADPADATAVVVGLDLGLSYERLTRAVVAIRGGARFIATNDDATYPMPDARYPGAGSVVAAVERATGKAPVVCGKPNRPMRDLIEQKIEHSEIWMVGDRPETDLALAADAGWGKILVLSGVTDHHDLLPADLRPDHTIATIAFLPDLLSPEHAEKQG